MLGYCIESPSIFKVKKMNDIEYQRADPDKSVPQFCFSGPVSRNQLFFPPHSLLMQCH